MNAEERIRQIQLQSVGTTGVRVLLVEGSDDVSAFRIFLKNRKQAAGWESKWHLEAAGNKRHVLAMLRLAPTWIGVVDRDDWTAAECESNIMDTHSVCPLQPALLRSLEALTSSPCPDPGAPPRP